MDMKKEHMQEDSHIHKDLSHMYGHGSEHGNDADGMSMNGHSMAGRGMEHMHMQKTFSLKTESTFLIEGFTISSIQGIVLAMMFTFSITILFDSLKFTMHLLGIHHKNLKIKKEWGLFLSSVSHIVSVVLAYVMMLCVMTMNVWLLVSVVLGSGIGHFIMRPLLSWKFERHSKRSNNFNMKITIEESEPLNDHNKCPENSNSRENDKSMLTVGRSLLVKDNTDV